MVQEDKIQKILRIFLDAGYNVSPDAVKLLSDSEDPETVAKSILEKIEHMEKKPLIIQQELFEPIPRKSMSYLIPGIKIKEDWDFAKVDTQKYTHGLHPYPARMIPQIAHRLIERYSDPYDLVLDPFCGIGTVLTEARLMMSHYPEKVEPEPPRNAVGNDLNPLALLLAKVKSKQIDLYRLDKNVAFLLGTVEEDLVRLRKGKLDVDVPTDETFPNITHWFKGYVIDELAVIRQTISDISDLEFRDFAKVCFSLTVRKASNIHDPGDTFIKRLPPEKLEKYNPNVPKTFKKTVIDSATMMKALSRICFTDVEVNVTFADTRNLPYSDNSIDLIVTSPPYGEERNTISYTRWSKLSSLWLGYESSFVRRMAKASLGGREGSSLETLSPILNKILIETANKDNKLARNAASFFRDYYKCLEEMYRVLKKGHFCCIVIGNRSLKRKRIPMDIVTREFGDQIDFSHERTYYRKIPTKAIPWVVAKGETIAQESMIVLKKT